MPTGWTPGRTTTAWRHRWTRASSAAACTPGYEQYWTAIQNEPEKPHPLSGQVPTPAEVEWAGFAARTPHYVLSNSLASAEWPMTSFLRGIEEVAALKQQSGKDIYLVGGARTTASLIDAGLVDELRLIVYPLLAGEGKPLFATRERRRELELRDVQHLHGGLVRLSYRIGEAACHRGTTC